MRWKCKPKTIFDKIKKRFAFFPVTINDEWVWLEFYYSITEEDYAGICVARFNTYKEAANSLGINLEESFK